MSFYQIDLLCRGVACLQRATVRLALAAAAPSPTLRLLGVVLQSFGLTGENATKEMFAQPLQWLCRTLLQMFTAYGRAVESRPIAGFLNMPRDVKSAKVAHITDVRLGVRRRGCWSACRGQSSIDWSLRCLTGV